METLALPQSLAGRLSADAGEPTLAPAEGTQLVRAPWAAERPSAAAGGAPDTPPPTAIGLPASPPRTRSARRATAFNEVQWLLIGTALVLVLFINAIGLWLARAGQSAAAGNLAEGVVTYIYDHLGAFKSVLTGLALVFAAFAVFSMRAAIVDRHQLSPELYRRLRQYHRLVGYAAIAIAFGVGLLTCVGIFGFGTYSPRAALHSALGSALLIVIVAKIAVVRYFPAQRRHLKLLGEGLFALFLLVFLSSAVPFAWSHINGSANQNPNYQRVGRAAP